MKFLAYSLFFLISAIPLANATLKETCLVAYETRSGFSEWARVNVSFASGRELGEATGKPFSYNMLSNYAMIWFDEDNVAILEIKSPLSFGREKFDREQWNQIFGAFQKVSAVQVNGGRKTRWILKRPLY